jgi:hypothetical protein
VRAAVAAAALLAGCGQGVHDLSVESAPLLVLRGHVELSRLRRVHPEAPLIGALVWAGVPNMSPVCLRFDLPEIRPACPDPYGVFYGAIERAAPVDGEGNFELQLFALPKASVSVGDEVTRIAYGSLLVAEDVNGDGQLTLVAAPSNRFPPVHGSSDPDPLVVNHDLIVAATFHKLTADQQRVVFREGDFVEDSSFYPAPGCGVPPPGFSILAAPPHSDAPAPSGACAFGPVTSPVEVPPVNEVEALAFMCRPVQGSEHVLRPEREHPAGARNPVCLSPDLLASIRTGTCWRLEAYALKGCDHDPFCTRPEWDSTASPPSWWPCR